MSDELDRRAALAMGWTWGLVGYDSCWHKDGNFKRLGSDWSPSTDRNDLAELLREVKNSGYDTKFISSLADKLSIVKYDFDCQIDIWSAFDFLTANPAVICEAACEVLEAANG